MLEGMKNLPFPPIGMMMSTFSHRHGVMCTIISLYPILILEILRDRSTTGLLTVVAPVPAVINWGSLRTNWQHCLD